MKIIIITLAIMLVFPGLVSATDYYVSTDGNDDNDGSLNLPFASPQKAVDMAMPGDRVVVRPGTYYVGNLVVPRSGEPGNPIIIEGEDGAVLDGGVLVTGWVPAPEVAEGVYKTTVNMEKTPHSERAYNLVWNNKLILHINDANMVSGGEGWDRLADPSGSSNWNGVEALYGRSGDTTYIRFQDNRDPNTGEIRVGPYWDYDESATVSIINRDYITLRGFTIQGRTTGVSVKKGSSNVIIENNIVFGGKNSIFVGATYGDLLATGDDREAIEDLLCHNVTVRNNEITLNYIYDIKRGEMSYTTRRWVWDQFKIFSDNDREAVFLLFSGHDIDVYGNHIYKHWGGVQNHNWDAEYSLTSMSMSEFGQRLNVHHNTIHDIMDDALEPGGARDMQWHDNLVYDSNVALRIKGASDTMYVYRNRFYGDNNCNSLFLFKNQGSTIYIYHNSFSSSKGITMPSASNPPGVFPNTWFVNNIFSNYVFWFPVLSLDTFSPHYHNNLNSGDYYADISILTNPDDYGVRTWAQAVPVSWFGENNIIFGSDRLWDPVSPDFLLDENSPAREAGIDLSSEWTLDGVVHPALPGMEDGYFSGTAPDLGALQYGASCTPSWSCTSWSSCSECVDNEQTCTRTCTDLAGCSPEYIDTGTQPCTEDADELILHLPFDEGSGTTTQDISGKNNQATINGASWTTESMQGNHALLFDGTDDYLEVPNSPTLNPDYITLSFWFRPDALTDNSGLVAKGDNTNRQYWAWIYDGNLSAEISGGGYTNYIHPLKTGSWYHTAITYDGSVVTTYINGEPVNTVPQSSGTLLQDDDSLLIGRLPGFGHFSGIIDDVRIYNYAMSESEITILAATSRADTDENGCIETNELADFISTWYLDSSSATMTELMGAVGLWRLGTGCPAF